MISYAQNFEDVILSRALADVPKGCYIDVGAHDPDVDTVSKAFFEKEWFGVHVEPVAIFADLVRKRRPGDVVLQAAVSSVTGLLSFQASEETGLSTAVQAIAQAHAERGIAKFKSIYVPTISLEAIFETVIKEAEVHWLKVDVEGSESDVLRSWGGAKNRPWIVVIESTAPLSTLQTHHEWEKELLDRGYTFAYFDGLNRFYVSEAKLHLKQKFEIPPNVFDGFKLADTTTFANQLGAQAKAQQESVRTQLNQEVIERLAVLDSIQKSLSQREHFEQSLFSINDLHIVIKPAIEEMQLKLAVLAGLPSFLSQIETNISLKNQQVHAATQLAFQRRGELVLKKIDDASNLGVSKADQFAKSTALMFHSVTEELAGLRDQAGELTRNRTKLLEAKEAKLTQLARVIQDISKESESISVALALQNKSVIEQREHISRLDLQIETLEMQARGLRVELQARQLDLDNLRTSKSWRFTAPLRTAYWRLRRDVQKRK